MNYTVFSDHLIGQSHVKMKMGCEDYSAHYFDEQGRYAIAVICDGHSDPRCFRSAAGARFGCETAVKVLSRFFDAYYQDDEGMRLDRFNAMESAALNRLKAAFVMEWERSVRDDLERNPITEENLKPLDIPQYRSAMKLYQSGKALNNVYGATLVCAAICTEFHLAMQIGDGIVVRLEGNGKYNTPLPDDDKNEMEGPASMCDGDLLTREKAFRTAVNYYPPQAMFVTSDGIGDMPMSVVLREHLYQVHRGMKTNVDEAATNADGAADLGFTELNEKNTEFLRSFVDYYTRQGVEDDCCLAGFFDNAQEVSEVFLESKELDKLYHDLDTGIAEEERSYDESMIKLQNARKNNFQQQEQYRNRLRILGAEIENLRRQLGISADEPQSGMDDSKNVGDTGDGKTPQNVQVGQVMSYGVSVTIDIDTPKPENQSLDGEQGAKAENDGADDMNVH